MGLIRLRGLEGTGILTGRHKENEKHEEDILNSIPFSQSFHIFLSKIPSIPSIPSIPLIPSKFP